MRLKAWAAAETKQIAVPDAASSRDIETIAGDEFNQDGPGGGLALRHLLRMIAYDPAATRARQTLGRLRPFVDGARLELQRRHEAGGTIGEHAQGLAQLMDGAVAGLCHVARFCVDGVADSVVAPFAAVAVGGHERREPSTASALDLLFLLPENPAARERADRMVGFVLTGLSELGFRTNHASCTPAGAELLAQAVPSLTARLRDVRFVWGCYSLYTALADELPKPANGSGARES